MSLARAVIFDLDGTLADTLVDIMNAMNHVLEARGLPTHDAASYRRMVGEGATRLAERAAPNAPTAALVAEFKHRYAAHLIEHSAPYPGIEPLLSELATRGVPMAVLSNKPHEATRQVVGALFPSVPFVEVFGQREGVPRKPDPAAALKLAQILRVAAPETAFVGDTHVDVETARAGGMIAVAAGWGFRTPVELRDAGAEAVLAAPDQLLRMLAS